MYNGVLINSRYLQKKTGLSIRDNPAIIMFPEIN